MVLIDLERHSAMSVCRGLGPVYCAMVWPVWPKQPDPFGSFGVRSRLARLAGWAILGVASGLGPACSGPKGSQGSGADDEPGGACQVVPKTVTGLTQLHVDVCSELRYPDQ